MSDAAQEYLDHFVDMSKSLYLRLNADFMPAFIAFEGKTAWLFPFVNDGPKDKRINMLMISAAFHARGIKRYAYFMDTWLACLDPAKFGLDPESATREQMAEIRRKNLPEHLADFADKKECIIWGMVNEKGPEFSMFQLHDSNQRRLIDKPRKNTEFRDMTNVFEKLLDYTDGEPDYSKIPKDLVWDTAVALQSAVEIELH